MVVIAGTEALSRQTARRRLPGEASPGGADRRGAVSLRPCGTVRGLARAICTTSSHAMANNPPKNQRAVLPALPETVLQKKPLNPQTDACLILSYPVFKCLRLVFKSV